MIGADLRDLLSALCDADARFLVIGGYAVGIHGLPRATKDLDVWVEASPTNARRVMRALEAFGAPLFGLTASDLEEPGIVLQIGLPPNRIDVTTKIDGVSFRRMAETRVRNVLREPRVPERAGGRKISPMWMRWSGSRLSLRRRRVPSAPGRVLGK